MKRFRFTLARKRSVYGLLFCLPFLLGLALIFVPALYDAIIFSTHNIHINPQGFTLESVGFEFYRRAIFDHPTYVRIFTESLTSMLAYVPLIIAFSFFMSGLLNTKFKGRALVRAIFFLPVIISTGIIVRVQNMQALDMLVNQDTGMTAQALQAVDSAVILQRLGIGPEFVAYLFGVLDRIHEIITNSGVQIIIFLAALQTIPPSLYEASSIEGASGWENFWKITFPMLTPFILTNVVYTIVDFIGSHNNPIMGVIESAATGSQANFSYSLAMSMIYFAGSSIVMLIIVFVVSRIVFYYD